MLLLPVLVLTLAALLPVEAMLRCYDCLSKSLPDCADDSKVKSWDQLDCQKDENFCSMLVMKDTAGHELVARQCASSPNESKQLTDLIRATHERDLTVTKFEVCRTDLCNVLVTPTPGTGGGALPSTISFPSLLSLTLGALAAMRLAV